MDIIFNVKLEILFPSLQIPVRCFACFPPAESSLKPTGTNHPSSMAVWGWGIYSCLSSDPSLGQSSQIRSVLVLPGHFPPAHTSALLSCRQGGARLARGDSTWAWNGWGELCRGWLCMVGECGIFWMLLVGTAKAQLHFQHDSSPLVLLRSHHQAFSEVFDTEIFLQKYLSFAFGLSCDPPGESFPAGAAGCAVWGALGNLEMTQDAESAFLQQLGWESCRAVSCFPSQTWHQGKGGKPGKMS